MRNTIFGITTGALALAPEVVNIDPEIINQGLQTVSQVILGIISIWHIIKAIFTKKTD